MAVVANGSSSLILSEDASVLVDSPSLVCPSSDERFWSTFSDEADGILRRQKRKDHRSSDEEDLEREKRFREDVMLLHRGFDSVSATLNQLTSHLSTALQGAGELGKPSLRELFHKNVGNSESHEVPRKSSSSSEVGEPAHMLEKEGDLIKCTGEIEKREKLKQLAASMATKAASLARELKSVMADLAFVQERCILLEEENKRLRYGISNGLRPEEDDLVRLQLEALLAEKSRLANENASLLRENQCLHQLVEYHQLTSNDALESYDEDIPGICLDFSSPASENGACFHTPDSGAF